MTNADVQSLNARSALCRTRLGRALLLSLAASPLGACSSTSFEKRASEQLFAPVSGSRIVVVNNVGAVSVTADPAATDVRAHVVRVGKGGSPTSAAKALEEVTASLEAQPDGTIRASVIHPNPSGANRYEVIWEIVAPPALAVQITNTVGEVKVVEFAGPIDISTDVGEVTVLGSQSGTSVRIDVGDAEVRSLPPISIVSDVGDIDLDVLPGASGAVVARTDVGSIDMRLPRGGWGELDVLTGTGDVDVNLSDLGLTGVKRSDERFSATLVGGQGAKVEARSGVGDVRVDVEPIPK